MKKQYTMFPIDKKIQISAKADGRVVTRVDPAATLDLSISKLNVIMSKWSEIEKR